MHLSEWTPELDSECQRRCIDLRIDRPNKLVCVDMPDRDGYTVTGPSTVTITKPVKCLLKHSRPKRQHVPAEKTFDCPECGYIVIDCEECIGHWCALAAMTWRWSVLG
eukprot:2911209-Prymnesium_polylepis.1